MPKLIPIVTTQETPTIDAFELAHTYIHRWPAQENVIKDYPPWDWTRITALPRLRWRIQR